MTERFQFNLNRPRLGVHADEGGQISALAVMAAAAFACLMVLVVNVGTATSEKIELQNAADATALSGAAWIARGMNVVSMNNVTQSQLLAIVLIIPALDKASDAAQVTLEIEAAIACAFSFTGIGAAFCFAIELELDVMTGVIKPAITAIQGLGGRNGALWSAMQILSTISGAVQKTFTVMAEAEAIRMAMENGATAGFLIPAKLSLVLPLHAGRLNPDLCDPTRYGSHSEMGNREYTPFFHWPVNQGPFEVYSHNGWLQGFMFFPVPTSFFNAWFSVFREAEYFELCGAPGEQRTTTLPAKDLATCRAGGGTALWVVTNYESILFPTPHPDFAVPPYREPDLAGPASQFRLEKDCSWTPPGAQIGTDKYRLRSRTVIPVGTDSDGNTIYNYSYDVIEYGFVRGMIRKTMDGGAGGANEGSSDDPAPYLLGTDTEPTPDAARQLLHYVSVAFRSRDVAVAPDHFLPALGSRRVTYAQARVYNPTAFDMFTQDWRVTLEPALMLEDGTMFGGLAQAGGAGAMASDAMSDALGKAKGFFSGVFADLLAALNNH